MPRGNNKGQPAPSEKRDGHSDAGARGTRVAATPPLVSVIVPAYNAQNTLAATLASVLTQTYPHFELIVVDDGSSDATAQIAERFAKRDERVVLLKQRNQGVGAARNLGLAHARGKYVAPLDADDTWFAQKLEKQVERLRQAPDSVGVVYTWSACIDDDGHLTGVYIDSHARGDVYAHLVYKNICGNASTPLIRRSCLDKVGGYTERGVEGCEDLDLYLRLADAYHYEVVPEFLVGYRQTSGSMSCNTRLMGRSYLRVVRQALRRRPHLPPQLFRWTRGVVYKYLAYLAERGGDHRRALVHLCQAGSHDPSLLLDPEYRRRFGAIAGKALGSRVGDWVGCVRSAQQFVAARLSWRQSPRSSMPSATEEQVADAREAEAEDGAAFTLADLAAWAQEWRTTPAGQLAEARLRRIDRLMGGAANAVSAAADAAPHEVSRGVAR